MTGSDGNFNSMSIGTTCTISSTGSCIFSYLSATGGDITGLTVRSYGLNLLGSLSVNGTSTFATGNQATFNGPAKFNNTFNVTSASATNFKILFLEPMFHLHLIQNKFQLDQISIQIYI